jgi:phospholipid/cholesterol/gamma-HCH transport system permease protein
MFRNIGEIVLLFWRTLLALPFAWRHRQKVFDQFFEIGNASLLMVCVLSFFIGAVFALQTGPALVEHSLSTAVGGVVGFAIARELAPIMMAILIAGRIGSAMAAEIGSMRVYQEIDALRTMNINPVHYLVLPRVLAMVIALPMLVIFAILVGWFGGAAVANYNQQLEIPFAAFFADMKDFVVLKDVGNGVFKSFCFAIIIGVVSCHQGLETIGGPRGIGRSVTKAVVNSIVMIVIFDYLITLFLSIFFK